MLGVMDQLEEDGDVEKTIVPTGPVPLDNAWGPEETGVYYDDLTGATLKTDLALAARKEELEWVRKRGVYEKCQFRLVTERPVEDLSRSSGSR